MFFYPVIHPVLHICHIGVAIIYNIADTWNDLGNQHGNNYVNDQKQKAEGKGNPYSADHIFPLGRILYF